MLAKQKEEMGAPLTKREKQAKAGIENITSKASFQNDTTCYLIGYLTSLTIQGSIDSVTYQISI